ncbi:MAG: GNAT family N-acetyltransferase [Candidatus Moraniibacteriota bacterium]
MKTIFRKYKSEDRKRLEELIQLFSQEERGEKMPKRFINKTINEFAKSPLRGAIYVFVLEKKMIGYAISSNYWSISVGGNYAAIDELFVDVAWRRRGIATAFIKYLEKNAKKTFVAISLEVGLKNKKAKKLYQKLGFKQEGYQFMLKTLKNK